LSPFLRLHFVPDGIIAESFITHADTLLGADTAVEFLNFLREPHSLEEIKVWSLPALEDGEISDLLSDGVLVETDDPIINNLSAVRAAWSHSSWDAAFYFNWATRNYKFLDYGEANALEVDASMMESYRLLDPMPSNFKRYPGDPIKFPASLPNSSAVSLSRVVRLEKYNEPKSRSVAFSDLGTVLFCAAGMIGEKTWPGQGSFIRRTVPSGGARHPTEIYIANLGIPEIPVGVYHYNVEHHGLDKLEKLDSLSELQTKIENAISDIRDRVRFRPQAVLILTSMLERSMWRYRDSRSYRVILIDVGHVMMNFRCCCESLGLSYFCGHGFIDSEITDIFNIESTAEIPLFVTMI
jgi:SagB-type dehydrogenase family enzyme